MRFFNNGTVLYAVNTISPKDMTQNLKAGLPIEKKIFLGYYELVGRKLTVQVKLHYCTMHFELNIKDAQEDPLNGWIGKYNILDLESHSCTSLQTNTPGMDEQRVLFHNRDNNQFVFWRQWYWGSIA